MAEFEGDAGDGQLASDALHFFDRALTSDDGHRAAALDDISAQLRASCSNDSSHALFLTHMPALMRMVTSCPFPDIRRCCARALSAARAAPPASSATLKAATDALVLAATTGSPSLYLPRAAVPTAFWPSLDAESAAALDQVSADAQKMGGEGDADAAAFPVCPDCGQRHAPTTTTGESSADEPLVPPSAPLPPVSPLVEVDADLTDSAVADGAPPPHDAVRALFEDLFLATGRVSNLDRVLALLPDFFLPAANTLHFVMREQGPLPHVWRNYLAFLASSQFRCDSLMSQQRHEFLANGGDPAWLVRVADAPVKLQNLIELNARLAHQPWTINRELVTRLLKGNDAWSVAELVHAIVLLSTYHYLACVSHGVGVTTDDDLVATPHASAFSDTGVGFATARTPASPLVSPAASHQADSASATAAVDASSPSAATSSLPSSKASPAVAPLSPPRAALGSSARLGQLLCADLDALVADVSAADVDQEVDPASIPIFIAPVGGVVSNGGGVDGGAASPSAPEATPASIDAPAIVEAAAPPATATSTAASGHPVTSEAAADANATPLSASPDVAAAVTATAGAAVQCPTAVPAGAVLGRHESATAYADFDMRSFEMFREQDYSWKEHGYALVNRFYRGVGPLLDAELDLIYTYTENNLGAGNEQLENVDTGPFRRAIWYYAHRMFGMIATDFDYRQVNVFLSRPLKAFIKRVVCYPDSIGAAEFHEALGGEHLGVTFRPSEQLHIVLLAAEGRRQACLLYGLHAVMQHMLA